MEPTQDLGALIAAHRWVPAAAILIGLLVRLQKASKLPGLNRVPAHLRPWLALGLGVVSGMLDRVVQGTPWLTAMLDGLLSSVIAITAHDAVVEGLRKGKEFGGGNGGTTVITTGEFASVEEKRNTPTPPTPTYLGPPPSMFAAMAVLQLGAAVACFTMVVAFFSGCGAGAKACAVIDLAQYTCTVVRYLEDDGTVRELRLTPDETKEFARTLARKRAEARDGGAP